MTRAIVAGALANKPGNGGAAWTRMSWAVGLRRLGFDVTFVEELAPGWSPGSVAFFDAVVEAFALDATLLDPDGSAIRGHGVDVLADLADDAALLVNLSGHLRRPEIVKRPRVTVVVDLDPGFTQHWHRDGSAPVADHDHHYTVGLAVGTADCPVPTDRRWRPILQPVLLDEWPVQPPVPIDRVTTVAAWRGFGTLEVDGRPLGPKAHELRRFADVTGLAPDVAFEIALAIEDADDADRQTLVRSGWRVVDPKARTRTPALFRAYVQSSPAEFSVAQGMYVQARTGWFSDRTTRYLASGRPAVVQDTGWTQALPAGEGLLGFSTPDEAAAAVRAVADDPEHHAAAARAMAEEHFASDVVLGRLCEDVGVAP